MTIIVPALLSSLCYGVADFLGGAASRKTSPVGVAALVQPLGLLVLGIALPFFPGHAGWADLVWGAASGLGYTFGLVLFYTALAVSRMAVVSPITAVIGASVPVLFGYLVGERPSFLAGVGIVAALFAVALLSVSEEKDERGLSIRDPGLIPALGSGLGFGFSLLCLSRAGHGAGLWPLLMGQSASMLGIWIWALVRPAPFRPNRAVLGIIALVALLGIAGSILYVLAVRVGLLPVVAVLVSLYPLSTILLAYVFLRERLSVVQWVGVLCALGGTALISRVSP